MENDSNNRENGHVGREIEEEPPLETKTNVVINEVTSLSPTNNQTYFANERIKIPEKETVSILPYLKKCIFYLIMQTSFKKLINSKFINLIFSSFFLLSFS